jgi:hypothetical protein
MILFTHTLICAPVGELSEIVNSWTEGVKLLNSYTRMCMFYIVSLLVFTRDKLQL